MSMYILLEYSQKYSMTLDKLMMLAMILQMINHLNIKQK